MLNCLGSFPAGTIVAAEFGPFYDDTGALSNSFSTALTMQVYLAGTSTAVGSAITPTQIGNVWVAMINTLGYAAGQYTLRISAGAITNGASVVGQGMNLQIAPLLQAHNPISVAAYAAPDYASEVLPVGNFTATAYDSATGCLFAANATDNSSTTTPRSLYKIPCGNLAGYTSVNFPLTDNTGLTDFWVDELAVYSGNVYAVDVNGDVWKAPTTLGSAPAQIGYNPAYSEGGGYSSMCMANIGATHYVFTAYSGANASTIIRQYALSGSATTGPVASYTLTGYYNPQNIKFLGGSLWVFGDGTSSSLAQCWGAQVNTGLSSANYVLLPANISIVTDDLAYDGTWIYIGAENGNGNYCRVNASTLAVQTLDLPGATYGMMFDGNYVWNCDITHNQLSRLDPNTLQVLNFALNTPDVPNEVLTNGTSIFYFTWDNNYVTPATVACIGAAAQTINPFVQPPVAASAGALASVATAVGGGAAGTAGGLTTNTVTNSNGNPAPAVVVQPGDGGDSSALAGALFASLQITISGDARFNGTYLFNRNYSPPAWEKQGQTGGGGLLGFGAAGAAQAGWTLANNNNSVTLACNSPMCFGSGVVWNVTSGGGGTLTLSVTVSLSTIPTYAVDPTGDPAGTAAVAFLAALLQYVSGSSGPQQFTAQALAEAPAPTINVTPAYPGPPTTGSVSSGNLVATQNSLYTVTFPVLDSSGNAVNLSGVSGLTMAFADPNNPASTAFSATIGGSHASLTIGGTSENNVTLSIDQTLTANVANLAWILGNEATKQIYTQGTFEVKPFPAW